MAATRVPTIEDLRVKLCYICREEELHDKPQDPPRPWTHPCKCTLIAHESCLLQWIRSSQSDSARAANALKCPQCGSIYELESERPIVLRLLDLGNKTLSVIGRIVTIAGVTSVFISFGAGLYTICTAYGAFAIQQFLGEEMFDLLLTDDPAVWPWHAFLNLPLIPLSLMISRMPLPAVMPLVPILLTWPSSMPVASRERSIVERWRGSSSSSVSSLGIYSWSSWPPSPAFVGLLLFPLARSYYRMYLARLTHWVLKTRPTQPPPVRRFRFALHAPFQIQLGANIENLPAGQQQQRHQAAGADANAQQQPQPNANANADENVNGDAALAQAAEGVIHVTGSSLGRVIGGALILPTISSLMGSLLLRLSTHSTLLRRFLAVRPSMTELPPALGPWSYPENWSQLSPLRQIGVAAQLVLSIAWKGTRTWAECDPVWWRNSLGLGVFVVAKDCLHLLHLWYAKRELETRRVKNKSFEGVDIKELDLINPTGAV